jgi:D-alanine-D-alanine ligase
MDKVITKTLLNANRIDVSEYVQINKCEYEETKAKIIEEIKDKISFPCIVKPAQLGSSVGVSICEDENVLPSAIQQALLYDQKVLIEKFIKNAKEYFCAVAKFSGVIVASEVDGVEKKQIFTFEEKYLDGKCEKNISVDKQLKIQIQSLSKKIYSLFECSGVVRIDFLYDQEKQQLYVNEINTIPGSLAFNLFNFSFGDFLNALINSAKENFEKRGEIVYKFNSSAIEHYLTIKNDKTKI